MAQPTLTGLTLNAGSGGGDLAHDVVDSKLWQAILVGYSTGDGAANVVMADTGLPVVAQSGATWAVTQSGTWNITNVSGTISLPTGASTAANQATANTALAAIETAVEGTLTVDTHAVTQSGTWNIGTVTTITNEVAINDGGNSLTVDGTVSAYGVAAENAAVSGNPVLTGGRYDLGARSLDNGDVGAFSVDATGRLIVSVGASTATVTVSGTVTANAGTNLNTSALALESGGNLATIAGDTTSLDGKVTACNTGAVVISSGTVTTVSTVTNLSQLGGTAISMDEGTVDAGTQRVSLATDDDGVAHLATIAGDTTAIQTAVEIIDNTVAVLGTATYSEASTSGTVVGAVRYDAGGTLVNTDNEVAPLQVDANGALRVTGGGGGTEYTEDIATANPIVGTATVMERDDALAALTPIEGDWAAMRCSAEGALWTQDFNSDAVLGDTNAMVVDLAAIEVLLDVVDDWDESDRAKVNPIAGQAGIAANAGNMDALTTRITIASDDTHYGAVGAASDIDGVVHGQLRYIADQLVTIDSDTNDIKTAVELIDNAISGAGFNVTQFAGAAVPIGAGTEAAALRVTQATDDDGVAHLATIAGDTTSLDGKVTACNTGAVVISSGTVTTVSTVTNLSQLGGTAISMNAGTLDAGVQRVTIATDDEVNNFLGAIDADTSALFGCVAGSELQVDVVAALPAGSNAIGKLAENSGVDIGDVDVTSVVPGVAATNLGKARASALGATDTGVADLAVRNDDLADLAGADGDYTPKQVDSRGALYVNQAAAEPKQKSGVAAGGAPGTDDMIAAVAGKKLLVLALSLFATSTTTNTVYVDNVDNDLLGNSGNGIALSLDADGDTVAGFVLPFNPGGWFKTDTVNEAVTLNTSAAQDIIWCITYIETD